MNLERQERARLTELAIEYVLGNLSADDEAEYQGLRARYPDFDVDDLEQATAALQLAGGVALEPLPERLQIRLATDAAAYFGPKWRAAERGAAVQAPPATLPAPAASREDWTRYGGWLAAAACLLVAVAAWLTRPPATATVASSPSAPASRPAGTPAPTPAPTPATASPATAPGSTPSSPSPVVAARSPADAAGTDPETARAQLLAGNRNLLRRAWRPGGDPAGLNVSGDVVWDPRTQTGYMRFVGLPRNDPNMQQYQLWIFDGTRDERYPIDGGVFNISGASQGEVVAIRAKLKVSVPLLFAVTIERPGGVVVSDRSRLAALANTT